MIYVVIPSYNREKTIVRAINSVLKQTYSDLEVIVVDDGSTDNTRAVLSEISDKRFRYIYQENAGACAARNNGIEHAKGEYIAFQDSDDAWRPEKLEKQIEAMQYYNADICFCRMERHNYPENKEKFYPNIAEGIVEYKELLLKSLASTQTIIAKREVYNSVMFDVKVKRMQDYDWMIRAAKHYSVCFIRDVLVDLYLQNDSITTFDYNKIQQINEFFLEKYKNLCDEYPEFYAKRLERIAYYKTLAGENASREYQEIYKITGKRKDLVKYMMARLGLLKAYYSRYNK